MYRYAKLGFGLMTSSAEAASPCVKLSDAEVSEQPREALGEAEDSGEAVRAIEVGGQAAAQLREGPIHPLYPELLKLDVDSKTLGILIAAVQAIKTRSADLIDVWNQSRNIRTLMQFLKAVHIQRPWILSEESTKSKFLEFSAMVDSMPSSSSSVELSLDSLIELIEKAKIVKEGEEGKAKVKKFGGLEKLREVFPESAEGLYSEVRRKMDEHKDSENPRLLARFVALSRMDDFLASRGENSTALMNDFVAKTEKLYEHWKEPGKPLPVFSKLGDVLFLQNLFDDLWECLECDSNGYVSFNLKSAAAENRRRSLLELHGEISLRNEWDAAENWLPASDNIVVGNRMREIFSKYESLKSIMEDARVFAQKLTHALLTAESEDDSGLLLELGSSHLSSLKQAAHRISDISMSIRELEIWLTRLKRSRVLSQIHNDGELPPESALWHASDQGPVGRLLNKLIEVSTSLHDVVSVAVIGMGYFNLDFLKTFGGTASQVASTIIVSQEIPKLTSLKKIINALELDMRRQIPVYGVFPNVTDMRTVLEKKNVFGFDFDWERLWVETLRPTEERFNWCDSASNPNLRNTQSSSYWYRDGIDKKLGKLLSVKDMPSSGERDADSAAVKAASKDDLIRQHVDKGVIFKFDQITTLIGECLSKITSVESKLKPSPFSGLFSPAPSKEEVAADIAKVAADIAQAIQQMARSNIPDLITFIDKKLLHHVSLLKLNVDGEQPSSCDDTKLLDRLLKLFSKMKGSIVISIEHANTFVKALE